ncbi:40S ribosomal protein S7 [Armadillidium nasatum]|uniref:40S ribosomal protein S7 n=1 Tax=Armadillidium nasatum TaxID=96803 RepID=A0A5N5T828_9CRUS|nr:40S ribosomal protein S7 [Armadillidium nasatum]
MGLITLLRYLSFNISVTKKISSTLITTLQFFSLRYVQCIAIFVPVPLLRSFQRVQQRLVRELEKKFSGKHVVVIAQRRILPKPTRKMKHPPKQKRPRSRTLTAVHDAILEDLVYPAEIVGKRIRVRLDSSRLIKVHLDKAQQTNIEHKASYQVETFAAVYKKLTGKDVTFEFREIIF